MKKLYLSLLFAMHVALIASAQAPQAIPYQAVARDVNSNIISNQTISLRFTIHDSIATGTVVYQEKQSATTNALGLFSVNIGTGIPVSPFTTGSFSAVAWGSNNKYTQVEMDITGGTSYVNMGTSQMLSVPYALYSGSSSISPAATASSNNTTAQSIPDNSCTGITSSITLSGLPTSIATNVINVTVNITHPFVSDLVIFLIAPDGSILALANQTGGAGQNYTNTIFSDAGSTIITAGTAPFTGTYRPQGSTGTTICSVTPTVSAFAGINGGTINPNGLWQLKIFDRAVTNTGTLNSWSISNIPNPITANYFPKWTASGALSSQSDVYDNGTTVGIGTTSPAASAALDVTGTTKGFLMPRMTAAQRNAITSPAVGLQIFNTDDQCVDIYNGSNWMETCGLKETGTATSPDYWPSKANFGGTGRTGAVAFGIGTKGYIGTGYDAVGMKNDFWEWDQVANTWTQKANFGGTARSGAVGFSIGTKGYIGTGGDVNGNTIDFWEWDQASNTWTQKANVGGTARSIAIGFSIGTKGYIGTGFNGSSYDNDFWEWDQTSNTWTQKANFGGTTRDYAVGFSIGAKGYIGTGYDGGYRNDFWEWDQASNTWTQKANFGGSARSIAAGFSIGAEGYIGTGFNGTSSYYIDFWQWDQASNTWSQKTTFSGTGRQGAVGFTVGTKGYIGLGDDAASGIKNDFWEYDPGIANAPVYAAPAAYGGAASVNDGIWTLTGNTVYNSNSGNVGIGTTSPAYQLDVLGTTGIRTTSALTVGTGATAGTIGNLQILSGGTSSPVGNRLTFGSDGSGWQFRIAVNRAGVIYDYFTLQDNGRIGISTTAPLHLFQLGADDAAKPSTSTWIIASDERLKNIEGAYTKGLKEILQLQPIAYHYKNVGERKFKDEVLKTLNVGFSAQEVQKVFPEAVGTDDDGYLNFNIHSILVAYVNAIKEQQKEIEALKTENAAMKKNETVMKQDIAKIKAQLGMDVKAEK